MADIEQSHSRVPWGTWSLQNKLLAIFAALLVLSLTSLFFLHLRNERRLLGQVFDYTAELSSAIEIAQDQPLNADDLSEALRGYMERLRRLGVKDVSITDEWEQVQASTNPGHLGKKLARQKDREWVIRGVLGDDATTGQKTSTLTIPLVAGDRRVGYLAITLVLDDFSALSRQALFSNLAALALVFGLGIGLSSYLSHSIARPIERLGTAAGRVAAGDLSVALPFDGGTESLRLAESFNAMVRRLRDRRELEERLQFAERAAALGRMGSAVAHEVRNPLNFLNLSIDHLRERLRLDDGHTREQIDPTLAMMKEEIGRLNRLVVEFLSFGKPLQLHRVECPVQAIVRHVASLVERKASEQRVTMDLSLPEETPSISGDPQLLQTCVLNLVINALEAMPEGGRLHVSLRPASVSEGEAVELVVSDSGKGMTPEELERAFEPYYSTKTAGLGLGLSLTRQILNEHGAAVRVDSAPQQGTTVCIRLPRCEQQNREELHPS